MQFFYTERFRRSYAEAPEDVQKRCDKQLVLLAENPRHPSLRTKKYDEARGIWQGRVTSSWRFYFTIQEDTYFFLDLVPHPK